MIKVVLVVNDEHVRGRVRRAIQSAKGLSLVAETGEQERVWAALRESQADVVVTELDPSNPGGIGIIRGLLDKRRNRSPVVVMSSHGDEEHAAKLLRMGVAGYVLKDFAHSELVSAVRAVHQGRRFVCTLIRDALALKYMELLDRRGSQP